MKTRPSKPSQTSRTSELRSLAEKCQQIAERRPDSMYLLHHMADNLLASARDAEPKPDQPASPLRLLKFPPRPRRKPRDSEELQVLFADLRVLEQHNYPEAIRAVRHMVDRLLLIVER